MIARVSLDLPVRREFDYQVPPEMQELVQVGSRVKVPFGPRQVLGHVVEIPETSPHPELRPILKVIGPHPLLIPPVLRLARWMAGYYLCPLDSVLKSVLPEAVRRERSGWREKRHIRRLSGAATGPLTARQQAVLNALGTDDTPLNEFLVAQKTTLPVVRRLEEVGLVAIFMKADERDPYHDDVVVPTLPLPLNADQASAVRAISRCLNQSSERSDEADLRPFLLHGVTGSGKTEVYLQALARALELGKGAIVLVPEISLTPQTVERFRARFASGTHRTLVAVLHSHLSDGERHDEWQKIRQGRARIVIGARSAIFAPVSPLGLIIVDEEHEPSYKQEETPRYHARDVAVMRASFESAVVVLGSATPSLESYHNARRGKYQLLGMPSRADDKKMPLVRVVDMRSEARKEKGIPILSLKLKEAILQRLEKREQVMLFLNRRGFASSVQCPICGHVEGCVNCSISLTYHRAVERLSCHICGYEAPVVRACPACGNAEIRFAGIGTEKVENALTRIFPRARIQRMDSDALKKKNDFKRILGDFRLGKIDILVGTQMIAKGLHFPNVTLVGIVYADQTLHMPDFRASERTFQLLTQVAGRAGRGDVEGEVFVQAFTPFHAAIQCARRHDFDGFFESEMHSREELSYPPLTRAVLLTLRGRNEDKVRLTADELKKALEKSIGDAGVILSGPAPSTLLRAKGFYRYQIMLRTRQITRLNSRLAIALREFRTPPDVTLAVDVDPVNLG